MYKTHINHIKYKLIDYLDEINNHCNSSILDKDIICIEDKDIISFINDNILDYNDIENITKQYTDYSAFRKNEYKLYRKLIRYGCLEKFTSHMNKKFEKYNLNKCIDEIGKYKTIKELKSNNIKCYYYINRHNLKYLLEKFSDKRNSKKK